MLSARLSSDHLGYNQSLTVDFAEQNLLPVSNTLPHPSSLAGLLVSPPCDFGTPFGTAVYRGEVTLFNFTTGTPLQWIDKYTVYTCGAAVGTPQFHFGPFQTTSEEWQISGYWTSGYAYHPGGGVSLGVLHPFEPGNYTLVTGDLWGHLLFESFTVG